MIDVTGYVGALASGLAKQLRPASLDLTYDWRERPGSPANTGNVVAACTALRLEELADATRVAPDPHLVPYVLTDAEGVARAFPRVTALAVAWLAERGWAVWCTAVVVPFFDPQRPPPVDADARFFGPAGDRYVVVPVKPCAPWDYPKVALDVQKRLNFGSSRTGDWTRAWPLRGKT